jgi:hypothetical protein
MKFSSSVGPVGLEDIATLSESQLLLVHNELRAANGDSTTKRFSDSKSGRERTTRAFELWKSRQPQRATPITPTMAPAPLKAKPLVRPQEPVRATPAPAARIVSAPAATEDGLIRLPARGDIRTHKPSTNRGKIITLGSREQGVTMAEMRQLTGWVPQQIRSCLRQINDYSGHGVEERTPDHFFITGAPRSRKEMSWPARGDIREHRKGTKRATVLEMLRRPEGASFEDVKAACGWNDIQAYEGIKLLHGYLGYGIEEKDGVIRAYTKEERK